MKRCPCSRSEGRWSIGYIALLILNLCTASVSSSFPPPLPPNTEKEIPSKFKLFREEKIPLFY